MDPTMREPQYGKNDPSQQSNGGWQGQTHTPTMMPSYAVNPFESTTNNPFAGSSGPYSGYGPTGFTRDDETLRDDIASRITSHPWIDGRDLKIKVQDGEVEITGTVPQKNQKFLLYELVDSVAGVQDLSLKVKLRQEQGSFASGSGFGR